MEDRVISALKESIDHHEENLRQLKAADEKEGKFINDGFNHDIVVGVFEIKYDANSCALCNLFTDEGYNICNCGEFGECPLSEINNCNNEDSIWHKIVNSECLEEAIEAEEKMVEVLKGLLSKEESNEKKT